MEGREDIRKIVSRKSRFADVRLPRRVRRLARLLHDPALAALRGVLAEQNARAWIVGGALRDLFLGREVAEVDLAVEGDAEKIARRMESLGRGRAVLLSGGRSPRVFRVAGRGRMLDLAEIEGGSIEVDLGRRDFSVNAIAADLASGEVLDPFGGVADLASRRLRAISEKNLTDDPLRALRAARLSATHGLKPDRATSAACRRAAPALTRVALERVQMEMAKLLEARQAVPALTWAAANGLLGPALGQSLTPRRATALARALAALDTPASARLPAERRRRLRLALLARQLNLSAREAGPWLRRLKFGSDEAVSIANLLALADGAGRAPAGDDVWRWLLEVGEHASDALFLLETLDPRSRPVARRLRALAGRRRPIPPVRGADVLEWLNVEPGPDVGKLLQAVRVEALAGRVRTRDEARDWLRGQKAAGRSSRKARRRI